ncbi:MAG TPA: hypothetical protein VGL39_27675 [Jatrophihabitantaceae bacterium]|jgi:hypothetical protein
MSRTKLTGSERAELTFPCAYCGAKPEDWCRVPATGRAQKEADGLHTNRWNQVWRIVELTGMRQSWDDAQDRWRAARAALRTVRDDLRPVAERGELVHPQTVIDRITTLLESV